MQRYLYRYALQLLTVTRNDDAISASPRNIGIYSDTSANEDNSFRNHIR